MVLRETAALVVTDRFLPHEGKACNIRIINVLLLIVKFGRLHIFLVNETAWSDVDIVLKKRLKIPRRLDFGTNRA